MDKRTFNKIAKKCPANNKHGQCEVLEIAGEGECHYDWCPERLRRDVKDHFDKELRDA
jgi:hypothetical protein